METLSKVTADPPKLQSKSSIGFIENIFFQIRNSWVYHPYMSSAGVLVFLIVLLYAVRAGGPLNREKLNAWGMKIGGKKGYFHLGGDEKGLGLLGGSAPNGKAD